MAASELGFLELLRWAWRQLTSMRTALVLLLLLALAAIPGSVIPQSNTDAFAVQRWQDEHPKLTPIYEKLELFSVFDSVWFSAIYLLLVVSLVGCILPRTRVYWRAFRAKPPAAPRNLARLPHHATYETTESADELLATAERVLRKRRYRVVVDAEAGTVSAEKGHLREAGNLLFHLAILVVLGGFATGSLWGYQGGVVVAQGSGFSNTITQYDDFVPGSLLQASDLEPFHFEFDKFDIEWLESGPRQGMAQKFAAHLRYTEKPGAEEKKYALRVNHPLSIGGTDLFLIGHGYAPHITVRDANGDIAASGPAVFLPEDQASFRSFGVVKASAAKPEPIGLEGLLFPTFLMIDGTPMSIFGDDRNPFISMQAYVGDLGWSKGSQSVYVLDKSGMKLLEKPDGGLFRVDLCAAKINGTPNTSCKNSTVKLPDGAGSVTFDDITPWVRIQISRTPGKGIALGGVVLALIGLLGSLFIRPRRVWVRVRRREDAETLVEVGGLERSNGGDATDEIDEIVTQLKGRGTEDS